MYTDPIVLRKLRNQLNATQPNEDWFVYFRIQRIDVLLPCLLLDPST